MPVAWRSLQSWQKLTITVEGGPAGKETLACMSAWLREQSQENARVAADMMDTAVDGYLREQDLVQVLGEDVIDGEDDVGLLFGRAKRGESSKTGRGQGVVMDEPWTKEILRRRAQECGARGRIFNITADVYRQWWYKAAEAVVGSREEVGPPHTARHTGPSCDLSTKFRTLDEIMKRGRWKAINSVHRYAKPHAWLAACANQSDEVRAKGRAILAARGSRVN